MNSLIVVETPKKFISTVRTRTISSISDTISDTVVVFSSNWKSDTFKWTIDNGYFRTNNKYIDHHIAKCKNYNWVLDLCVTKSYILHIAFGRIRFVLENTQ